MATGFFNPLDAPDVPNPRPFPTEQAMLDEWYAGNLSSVITATPPADAATVTPFGTRSVVVLDQKGVSDAQYSGRICAASPEQRDLLSELLGDEEPADLKLLTQQEYLNDPSCVDIYVTAVPSPSAFLQSLGRPVYIKSDRSGQSLFPAQQYAKACNVGPAEVRVVVLYRCG